MTLEMAINERIIRNKENKSLELKGSMVKCIFFSRSLIKLWFYLSKSDRLQKELYVLGKLSIWLKVYAKLS